MTDEEEVLRITRKLREMAAGDRPEDNALDLLKRLKELPIDLDVLQDSTRDDGPVTQKRFPYNKTIELDEFRKKYTEMLLTSLQSGELPDGSLDARELAERIENRLYEVHSGTTDKYKAALRSRVFNLRDRKNPELRENILMGVVSPERFATMSSEEMASSQMKEIREKFTKEAINEHQMTSEAGTPTDMFKCGKCKKKNCTYTQVQTRSADEPMTTFVFCRECGNRWKQQVQKDSCGLIGEKTLDGSAKE